MNQTKNKKELRRELDLFIGKKITYWKCSMPDCKKTNKFCADHCPPYSSNISDALTLIEDLKPLCIEIRSIYGESHTCVITDARRGKILNQWSAFNQITIPLAVSIAAALAWGFEYSEDLK